MKLDIKTIALIIIICLCAFWLTGRQRHYDQAYRPNRLVVAEQSEVITIFPGMMVRQIADTLFSKKIIDKASDFVYASQFLHLDLKIQAGEYLLPFGNSNAQLLNLLCSSGTASERTTIPEGLTTRQMAGLLRDKLGIDSVAFLVAVKDQILLRKYGIEAPSFEGYLYPDSYNFFRGVKPTWIINKMVNRFFQVFDSSKMARCRQLKFTRNEMVTLASIIQGEMAQNPEATIISAVYHNRLKKKMPLQADPTLQYIIPDSPRRLYDRDLELESSYNTYKFTGLPPGAVCNPGKVALEAALNPASVDYLFMVAQGDGSHAFSRTYDAHLHAKVKLDHLRAVFSEPNKSHLR
jgi:UPF0755 protein